MPTTLRDVAARAGVSIKTVSNVVNERPYVTDDTRERVLKAIEALHYRPNISARHLRTRRIGVIALAVPEISNTYFTDLGRAVSVAAAAHGYTVLLDHTGGDRASEAVVAQGLRPHLVDGVILNALSLERDDLRSERVPVPIVLVGERLLDMPYDHVGPDNVAAARAATEHLLALGRRRIAAIGVQEDVLEGASRLRLQGYSDALRDAGQEVDPRLLGPAPGYYRLDGARAMRDLLRLDDPPDAVFCFNDLMALGAIRALHDAGRRVPDDVAVVGYDDVEEGLFATPSLTTISPDKEEIGRLAVRLLIERVEERRNKPPAHFDTPFRLVVRESTAGPSGAAAWDDGQHE